MSWKPLTQVRIAIKREKKILRMTIKESAANTWVFNRAENESQESSSFFSVTLVKGWEQRSLNVKWEIRHGLDYFIAFQNRDIHTYLKSLIIYTITKCNKIKCPVMCEDRFKHKLGSTFSHALPKKTTLHAIIIQKIDSWIFDTVIT